MRNTNAPRPVARLTGRDGSTDSGAIVAPASAHEALFDLRSWAKARRFRVQLDPSFDHEADLAVRGDGRSYIEVPGQRGMLYSLGADAIGAWTDTRGVLAELLAPDPAIVVHQRGDAEAVVRFPSRLLDAVAQVIRPLRIPGRPATAEDRDRLARTAFRPALQAHEDAPGRDGAAPGEESIEVRP
jgi:hypothetical protein